MPKVTWLTSTKPKVNYLAAVFHSYRKSTGMTSADIGRVIGCSPENVRKQLTKPADDWNIGHLKKYCDILNIPYSEALEAAAK